MKEFTVSKEFVEQAYDAACHTWRKKIAEQFPEIFQKKVVLGDKVRVVKLGSQFSTHAVVKNWINHRNKTQKAIVNTIEDFPCKTNTHYVYSPSYYPEGATCTVLDIVWSKYNEENLYVLGIFVGDAVHVSCFGLYGIEPCNT